MEFSEKIKQIRQSKKISQKELASSIGVTQATITKIESGLTKNTSIDIAMKIANALGANLYELVGEEMPLINDKNYLELIKKLTEENKILESFRGDSLHWLMINAFAFSSKLWDAHKDLENINTERSKYYLEGSISMVDDFIERVKVYYQTGFITEDNVKVLKSWFNIFEKHPLYFMLEKLDELPNRIDFEELIKEVEKRNKAK